jgi:hypothetical protein
VIFEEIYKRGKDGLKIMSYFDSKSKLIRDMTDLNQNDLFRDLGIINLPLDE